MEKYKVIYADPPWYFKTYSKKGEGRSSAKHYSCMNFEELCEYPVQQYADDDCVLLLWVTDPMLQKAFKLIEKWGFTYKTVGFYWIKTNKVDKDSFFTGMGYWTRANPEQCLLATKGNPKRIAKNVRRLIVDQRREHSRKPDEVYNRIEQLLPGPYLELFARNKRNGWTSLGDEVDKFMVTSVPGERTLNE